MFNYTAVRTIGFFSLKPQQTLATIYNSLHIHLMKKFSLLNALGFSKKESQGNYWLLVVNSKTIP